MSVLDERRQAADETAIGNAAFVLLLRAQGVRDTAILRAMEQVPRETFAPAHLSEHARRDIALPLPCGQSMTAPSKIAAMLAALDMPPAGRVLEIGTGSGFVTALLVRLGAGRVLSLERYASLACAARDRLREIEGASVAIGDGLAEDFSGEGSFERILVNGLCPAVPERLCAALAPGGRLVGAIVTRQRPSLFTVERGAAGDLLPKLGRPLSLPPLTAGRARVL